MYDIDTSSYTTYTTTDAILHDKSEHKSTEDQPDDGKTSFTDWALDWTVSMVGRFGINEDIRGLI